MYCHHNYHIVRKLQSLTFFDPAVVYNEELEDEDSEPEEEEA